MNIDLSECNRWSHKCSNKILNVLREGNWLGLKNSTSMWTTISPILTEFVLQDDGVDFEDKRAVVDEVIDRWCAFIRSSCDPNLPNNKRQRVFNKCSGFANNITNTLKEELPQALDVYQTHHGSLQVFTNFTKRFFSKDVTIKNAPFGAFLFDLEIPIFVLRADSLTNDIGGTGAREEVVVFVSAR